MENVDSVEVIPVKVDFSKARSVVTRSIPDELIKQRDGARGKKLSYISGPTVEDLLNEAFDYLWEWEIKTQWIQESIPAVNKDGKELPQKPVAHVVGTLTVWLPVKDGQGYVKLRKDGAGSKSIIGNQSEQESIYKAADTDALKKAASRIGIGKELYRDEEEQAYFEAMNFEDPWTDDVLEKYRPEQEYLHQVIKANNFNDADMDTFVKEWSEGQLQSMEDIRPDNIAMFVAWMKEAEEGDQN